MITADAIANSILAGFDKHYGLFREVSAAARYRFERADWAAVAEANRGRIDMYDLRVGEAVKALLERFPEARGETLWPEIKRRYIGLLHEHKQPELAETFYNSVACRVLHRHYYNNAFIFWRPAVSTEHIESGRPDYRAYYPKDKGLRASIGELLSSFELANPFEDLPRDIDHVLRALQASSPRQQTMQPNCQLQTLDSLFYRNKAAYIVGRLINGNLEQPLVIPLLQNERGELRADALLLSAEDLSLLFSFARAYFMVDMEVPSAYVAFLRSLLPNKPVAEIYTLLGLQKQGKTMFYRDLQYHLRHSTDNFVIAPGIRGMVMLVFTLPSFSYVFKIIKDRFEPPKDTSRTLVQEKYQLVKHHDRVGRLADTLEYSDVAFPLDRIDPELLQDLQVNAGSSIEIDGDRLIVRHVYIERRMTPLNIFLRGADEPKRRNAIREYGNAIRDLAAANIFPGDMLQKNFGVTRFGRVVFYDYDEICYLTDCKFRRIPPAPSIADEMLDQSWHSVEHNDVFPEQFGNLAFPIEHDRRLFLLYHQELLDAGYWRFQQRLIETDQQDDVFPYSEQQRFIHRFAANPELAE